MFLIRWTPEPEAMARLIKSLFQPADKVKPLEDACILLESAEDLDAAVKDRDKLMVLFYASWCPFSQAFLKNYLAHAASGDPCYARIVVDDDDPLVDRFQINVFPTVLFFENGRMARRLDGVFHQGLSQAQLSEFARRCAVK
jgi:thioredoxin-like negative regulator of GroEL